MYKGTSSNIISYLMVIFYLQIQNVDLKLLVQTKVGRIQGVPADDGDYVMFLGIPYAKVNASNPFGASSSYPKFENIFMANNDTVICPQFLEDEHNVYSGVIDCLQINIYIPNTENDNKAIFVYIHGGRNVVGYKKKCVNGPKYLVRHGIIVVNFNYRLGPYGFLCTDHPEVPGNQGLKDQYSAIKWIKDNIQAFGGDPQKITLGGHSSGSMCVDAHLLTKQPRLFQQAILQSGAATFPRFLGVPNTTMILDISHRLGLKTSDVPMAIHFLSKADPETIIAVHNSMPWNPCIEYNFEELSIFIDEHPEISQAKNVNNMNILGGFTNRECILCTNITPSYSDAFSKPDIFEYDLNLKFDLENTEKIVKIIKHFYSGDVTFKEMYFGLTVPIAEFLSDYDVVYPIQRALMKYTNRKNTKIFQYMFSYDGDRNLCKKMHKLMSEPGAAHCDELGYIFTNMKINPDNPNEEDEIIINRMTKLWTNFIKYGNPTPYTSELIPIYWPPLTKDNMPSLLIDRNLSIVSWPFRKNMAFWDLFFEANADRLKVKLTEKSPATKVLVDRLSILMLLITILPVVGIL